YDTMNRLVTSSASAQAFAYAYDRFGNRWQQNVTSGTGPGPSYIFDANNRIIGSGIIYDAAGNVINDGTHTYTYDAENRISAVDGGGTAAYTYSAAGARVRKTSAAGTVDYIYDLGGHAVTEVSSSGVWNRGEVYGGGRHLATYSEGQTYFSYSDWLGSERARTTTSGAGAVTETCTNLPYGDSQVCSGPDSSPLHFTSQMRDIETGLDEFPARYYSSVQGRWYSPDWASAQVPVPYADLGNPQTLNLYDYVGGDPTNHADADGHFQAPGQEAANACALNEQCTKDKQAEAYDQTVVPHGSCITGICYIAQNQSQGAGQGQGAGQHQNGDVATANHYLSGSKEMRLVQKAFKSGHFHLVIIHDGNDRYDPVTRTVYWDPHSALQTTAGGHQTPALGLGHEMAHATGNRHDTAVLSNTFDAQYDTKEERRVILNYENPAARELGESTRSNHGGVPYNVNCPTCQ
ncbi:MAG: RHS repeat-associated core domain-containing protein, partial [Acidobacteria bacterium]|nr:RHS repeat-associated core domain-containing protein [Acidobacteriota bacterium]